MKLFILFFMQPALSYYSIGGGGSSNALNGQFVGDFLIVIFYLYVVGPHDGVSTNIDSHESDGRVGSNISTILNG